MRLKSKIWVKLNVFLNVMVWLAAPMLAVASVVPVAKKKSVT